MENKGTGDETTAETGGWETGSSPTGKQKDIQDKAKETSEAPLKWGFYLNIRNQT